MAIPSVSNTFSNGTTADASQVNTNFTDLINAMTDASKSFSIDALTCAGAATLNGNVTLGNGSPDDITFTGSLASSIPIKTNNAFDLGAATLAMASVYLGAPSSRSTRIRAHQSLGASNTLVLPNGGGTAEYEMCTDGSGNLDFRIPPAGFMRNIGLSNSVGSNSMTIALKDAAGNDPSATSAVAIMFRSSTATTGLPVIRQVTGALSMPITASATLGHASAQIQYIYVYLIDNAGTVELAVSGQKFTDEGSLVTTTAMSAGATSGIAIYSTTSRSNVPIRLIGRLKSNQTTAGTWTAAATEQAIFPFEQSIPRSEVWVYAANGYGSTNNKIRRWTTTGKSVGNAISYTDSAANGGTFTINEDGVYSVHYSDQFTGAAHMGISVNSSQLTTSIASITAADVRAATTTAAANYAGSAAVTLFLLAGDVVRPHTEGTGSGTATSFGLFRITKVSL